MRSAILGFTLILTLGLSGLCLADSLPAKLSGIPVYSGATLYASYQLSDQGYGSAQYMAAGASQSDVVSFYKSAMSGANWSLNEESDTDDGSHKLVFQRGNDVVFVTYNTSQSNYNLEISISANQ